MPLTENFPFRRVAVDHMILGTSRIWWQMDPAFTDPGPHVYQLQAGHTGLETATDWVDVGGPVTNAWYAEDDERRLRGMRLLTHYRIKLTTPTAVYVSRPAPVYGQLPEEDWITAKEIIRKAQLKLSKTGTPGLLIKRFRFGAPCTLCLDYLTKQPTDPRCPECRGTRFKVGYHAPVPLQCWDTSPQPVQENRGGAQPPGQSRPTQIKAQALAFPDLALEDIWVNAASDERWSVTEFTQVVTIRGVPLHLEVTLDLLPYSDVVYQIPVGAQSPDLEPTATAGSGCVSIDQDYGGNDALTYQLQDGCPVGGADIWAIPKTLYESGLRDKAHAVAIGSTDANGRWNYALKLDPGDYYIVFSRLTSEQRYGPDAQLVTVTAPARESSSSSSFSSSFSSL